MEQSQSNLANTSEETDTNYNECEVVSSLPLREEQNPSSCESKEIAQENVEGSSKSEMKDNNHGSPVDQSAELTELTGSITISHDQNTDSCNNFEVHVSPENDAGHTATTSSLVVEDNVEHDVSPDTENAVHVATITAVVGENSGETNASLDNDSTDATAATTAVDEDSEKKTVVDKKEKLDALRYGEKGKPVPSPPKPSARPDADLLKMMKQSSTKLKSFDYSKLRGKKKELVVSTAEETLSPPPVSSSPDKISRAESQGNSLTPKKQNTVVRDYWLPPGGHFYEYEDLVAVNITKDYGNLQENHLEAYLTSSDFEKLFGMNRKNFYELPDWRQQQLKREKRLF